MEVGYTVWHKKHKEYGTGKIINKETTFGQIYYEVLFDEIDNVIQLTEQDLELVKNSFTLFKQGQVDDLNSFVLKTIAHKLETYYSGDAIVSSVNFKIKPLPHQILALNFVLNRFKSRCLLADEVGLGKTIEAALIFEELKLRGIADRILIITPAGLTKQWQEELQLKFSEEFYLLDNEKAKALKGLHGKEGNIWYEFDQVITSIDYLKPKRLREDLSDTEYERRQEHNEQIYQTCIEGDWDVVIFDEAHKLTKYKSGKETARYKLGSGLAEVSPVFLLLTATPHSGKTDVFQNLLKLIDPHLFYSKDNLKPDKVKQVTVRNKKRAVVDMEGNRLFNQRITTVNKISWDEKEDTAEKELYHKIVDYVSEYYNYAKFEKNYTMILLLMLYQRIVSSSSRAVLKTLKKRYDHLKKIENVSRRINDVDMDSFLDLDGEKQLEFIEENMSFLKNSHYLQKEIEIIEDCITTAKKAIKSGNDAKFRKLLEIIDEVKKRENNPEIKMIIFTEFIETQKYIIESLEKLDYETAYINGNLSLEEKIKQKNLFKDEAQFLVSTDAGGEGINLQFCYYMINYDLPWNPMKLEQRIGRIDRIGQKEDVKVFNFILEDTVEEHVRDILEDKLNIIKEQFGEDKLSDILSTLQEDFNFDQIYFDAIVNDEIQEEKLEKLGQEMYNKAQEIIKEEELLIPFDKEEQNLSTEDRKLIDKLPDQIKEFTDIFLSDQGMKLEQYSNKENVYYFKNKFKNNEFKNHFSKVIFDPQEGLENEEADLFSLNHDFVQEAIENSQNDGIVTAINIEDGRFQGKEGFLSLWQLKIENNFDFRQKYYIPIFLEEDLRYNSRISRLFNNIEMLTKGKQSYLPNIKNPKEMYDKAKLEAEKEAEDVFLEEKLEWQNKLEEQKAQLKEYYKQKEKAIKEIKIDNIREGRMEKFNIEWLKEEQKLNDKAQLFPKLTCEQLAYIRFR